MKALRREGRRGVSPVIATLLLIVIAVAAAVLVYMWVVGYTTQMRPRAEVTERLKIEAGSISISGTDVAFKLHVRNVGESTIKVTKVYLLNFTEAVLASADVDYEISPGKTSEISDSFTDAATYVTKGLTYIVRVVTERGTESAIVLKMA